jgi:hypothetical protein
MTLAANTTSVAHLDSTIDGSLKALKSNAARAEPVKRRAE